jgi:hypothetical protein
LNFFNKGQAGGQEGREEEKEEKKRKSASNLIEHLLENNKLSSLVYKKSKGFEGTNVCLYTEARARAAAQGRGRSLT